MDKLDKRISKAVKLFWKTRQRQDTQQGVTSGQRDTGNRTCVTGGKQMDGFVGLIEEFLLESGNPSNSIYCTCKRELPGYFRAEKNWDLVVVHQEALVAAMEFKSQVGSFGNNFNNRTEEALGSATDIWTAYREGAFKPSERPWLGYLMMLEDVPRVHASIRVNEPHFNVFDEFRGASYAKRYELLILRLLRERLYDGACFLMSNSKDGIKGNYREPVPEINFLKFAMSLIAHASAHIKMKE
jgi:hypothetical protein